MHLVSVVILTCVVEFIETQTTNPGELNHTEDATTTTENNLLDHTFVALIDIVFTDFSKRTCTGTIIHDNVVITAAHCFSNENTRKIKIDPELTTSFVVIGTKKMFETGYEQYLPIERVVTHPGYRGWTADVALVYTFAGMTSDKPGSIIPLAGEKTFTEASSNVTVLSWGHLKDIDSIKDWKQSKHEKCPDSTSVEDNVKSDIPSDSDDIRDVTSILEAKIRHRSNVDTTSIPFYKLRKERDTYRSYESRVEEKIRDKPAPLKSRSQNIKVISRYLSGEERTTKSKHSHQHRKISTKTTRNDREILYYEETTKSFIDTFKHNNSMTRHKEYNRGSNNKNPKKLVKFEIETDQDIYWRNDSVTQHDSEDNVKMYYKNWRRQMGKQQNQLTVEIFGFVNVQACKKLVEKAMPPLYDISGSNDVVCYASGYHFVSDEDSGAPAVRHGQLVAVTVGGAEIDGDHVAVGMKISCYCSWIADNLPDGGSHLQCCSNCCDVKHKEEYGHRAKHFNKYLT